MAVKHNRVSYVSQFNFFDKRDYPRIRMHAESVFDVEGRQVLERGFRSAVLLRLEPDFMIFYSFVSESTMSFIRKPESRTLYREAVKVQRMLGFRSGRVRQRRCLYLPPPSNAFNAKFVKGRYFWRYVRKNRLRVPECAVDEFNPRGNGGLDAVRRLVVLRRGLVGRLKLTNRNANFPNQFAMKTKRKTPQLWVFSEVGSVVRGAYDYFVASSGDGGTVMVGVKEGVFVDPVLFKQIAGRIERAYGFKQRELVAVKNGKSCNSVLS